MQAHDVSPLLGLYRCAEDCEAFELEPEEFYFAAPLALDGEEDYCPRCGVVGWLMFTLRASEPGFDTWLDSWAARAAA